MRSYGKVVYVFGPLPILGFIIFLTKILGMFPLQSFQLWLHSQDWSAFIYNAKVSPRQTESKQPNLIPP